MNSMYNKTCDAPVHPSIALLQPLEFSTIYHVIIRRNIRLIVVRFEEVTYVYVVAEMKEQSLTLYM